MMRRIASGLVVGMMIAGSAQGASLFLRVAGADNQSAMTANLGELVTLEVVLVLAPGEELGFATMFLDTDTDDEAEIIEALDFVGGLEAPASYDAGHSVFSSEENPFPFEAGAGISLEDYAMILNVGDEPVSTEINIVLEQIVINTLAAGTVAISFEEGARDPSLSMPVTFVEYQIATVDVPADLEGFLYLGVGDAREGGAGALMLTIVDNGAPGNENDNTTTNGNDNNDNGGNDNDRNDGPRATGGTNICGFGLMGPMLTCAGLLALSAGRRRR